MLDVKLAEDAKAAGKQLEGLETIADQLHAMASLPMEFHIKGLVETLKLGDRMDDVIETMIVPLRAAATPARSGRCSARCFPNEEDDKAGYAAFEQAMISSATRRWSRAPSRSSTQGNAFIAVGALHLPGPDGLIELLSKAGHTVTAVN